MKNRPRLNYLALTWNVVRKAPLLAQTISRMFVEDPLLLSVQSARRLPKSLRDWLAQHAPGNVSLAQALIEFISDHPERARETLRQLPVGGDAGARLQAELSVQLGIDVERALWPATRARAAWAAGQVSGLSAGLPSRSARRFRGEERIHRVGSGIVLSDTLSALRTATRSADLEHPRVFHFLTNSLPWTRSGYTYRTQAVLHAQQQAGIDVRAATRLAYPTLIGRPWAGTEDNVDGVVYQRLEPLVLPAGQDERLYLQARMLLSKVRLEQPDVLQTTTNFHNALTVDSVARASGLPWVYEMRGNMEQSWIARQLPERQETLLSSERYTKMRERETEMALRANHVIVLSNVQREDLISRGVPSGRISVIPNSVDGDLLRVERDPRRAREKLGLPDGFWVGSVTAVVDYEGLPTLLHSVALLRGRGYPVKAAIVGDGIALPGLRLLAEDLGISDHVVMPGRVSQEEALDWYAALDAFAIPRKSTEVTRTVTPLKGIQAMAMGVPLVVSDLPALVEAGAGAGQALVVPPDDPGALAESIEELMGDRALVQALSEAGRLAAADRTWNAAGQKYLDVYQSLLK